jgi:beta-lactamase superfamily II metal-dependent hydrolase
LPEQIAATKIEGSQKRVLRTTFSTKSALLVGDIRSGGEN